VICHPRHITDYNSGTHDSDTHSMFQKLTYDVMCTKSNIYIKAKPLHLNKMQAPYIFKKSYKHGVRWPNFIHLKHG